MGRGCAAVFPQLRLTRLRAPAVQSEAPDIQNKSLGRRQIRVGEGGGEGGGGFDSAPSLLSPNPLGIFIRFIRVNFGKFLSSERVSRL